MKSDSKRRVTTSYWPERHGTVIREGVEVSEVAWDKTVYGEYQTAAKTFEPNYLLRDLGKRWKRKR